ncbi:ABC transporter substrate-binding protein [Streptacidiphilus carbonis]|uniref:ABC transporter substrate-binding protein n=1 Tax=Streptacidiphilus carbonis TaxID=105422 RepID=UPI000693D126|nr:ABC transporter substrate-binding protein [Streptacidiphilus carbonis]
MRTRPRLLTAAAAASALVLGLAACSSSSGSATVGGRTTLTVVGFEGGGNEIADIPAINAAFEKAHPDVKVDYKYVANTEYDAYNNTRLAAGTAADVLMVNKSRLTTWQQQGFLADLSDQPWVKRTMPSLAPYTQVGGKTYDFVQQNIPIGLYANMSLLKQAGITQVPRTWPELLAALQTLKAKNIGGLEIPNLKGWDAEQVSLALAANLVDPAWGSGYDNGGSTWAASWSPVIDHLKQLLTGGLVDGKTMNGIDPFSQGVAGFTAGKWAFYVDGAWDLTHYQQAATFDFTLNPFPGGPAGSKPKTFTFIGSGWSVNAASKQQQAAKEYVDFMSQPAQDSAYLKAESCFSTLTDVPSPQVPQAAPVAAAFAAGDTSPSQVEVPNYPNSEDKFTAQLNSLFNDPGMDTGSLLAQLDKDIPKTPAK